MDKKEQAFIDKLYSNRFTWSHDFIITCLGVLNDEIYRRIDDFHKIICPEEDKDGIQDM